MEQEENLIIYYGSNTHVESFEYKKEQLAAIRSQVLKDIEDAKKRNVTLVDEDDDVRRWLNESDAIIKEDTETSKSCFDGCCPDAISQLLQGKKFARKMQYIEDLIRRSRNFPRLEYQAEIPIMEYHGGSGFIDFESRKSKLEELVEALENENYYMIGLQGLEGIGKTTLAQQVGVLVEESEAFQNVIFTTVSSNPPNINKIQADIALQLGLSLREREEAEHSEILCSRIAIEKGRLLIILDDVWSALDLEDIGIPLAKNNCCVLVTTRDVEVCGAMRCQLTIHLQTLTDGDSLALFKIHANHDDLNCVARDIVKECGGLPVANVAMGRTLRNWHVGEWKAVLTTLQKYEPCVDVDKELTKAYKCLQLSYNHLRNEKAKMLLLLCCLFPEDYEIPVSLLISLGIGIEFFGEVDKYCEARSQALAAKDELIDSSLLKVEKECVKMHDLVREVMIRRIAKEDIQVIKNSQVTPKSNLRFLFWSGNDFPNQFDGAKLEIILLWIKGCVKVEDANAIFEGMRRLRVLVLCCYVENRLRLPLQSFLLLKNIRTLILDGWKLDDIFILESIQSLETLELNDCSIIELPKEIEELKMLKLLRLRGCKIERNNPFEVIERCSQLEELYFVENTNVQDWKQPTDSNTENIDKVSQDISPVSQDISPPAFQMYSIACSGLEYFDDDEMGLLKCFNTKHVRNLISRALFQYLLEKAEVLELGGKEETRWRTSLIPDIIPIKDGAMNDLMKLCLYEWDGIDYLIDARELLINSSVTIFSKLVELHMRDVGVEELCRGPMTSGFLEQLQVLKLLRCMKLQNIFLNGTLKLPHLKVLKLENCPMFRPFIFTCSVARSLARLEELVIEDCNGLRSLIEYESSRKEMLIVDHQNSYDLLFPRLETLKINGCQKLEVVSPLLLAGDLPLLRDLSIRYCRKLRYIFDEYRHDEDKLSHQHTMLPSLSSIDLYWVPSFINIFRVYEECIAVSKAKMQQHTISLGSPASRKGFEMFTAECLFTPPLVFQNIRKMELWDVSNLKSLFNVSIAASIMLEKLKISYCEELKHIIANGGQECDHMNYGSIFPNLKVLDIYNCNKLEFICPSTIFSGGLQKLKYLTIYGAFELKYVFGGKCNHLEDSLSNDELHIDLPALKTFSLEHVPNMISICINKYDLQCPSFQNLDAAKTTKGEIKSETEEIISTERPVSKYGINFHNLQQITITGSERLESMFSSSTWRSLPQLSQLRLWECDGLRSVVEDDSIHHHHISDSSIFPRLEDLEIRRCMNLEFIFPTSVSGDFPRLKHLVVREAPKLKYIFGKYLTIENNESDEVLSALETLSLTQVPKMINISAKKQSILRLPSLQKIALDNCQELSARPFPNLLLYWKPESAQDLMKVIMHQQKLTSLAVESSIIEEVFNLEDIHVEVEGLVTTLNLKFMTLKFLRELRCIYGGPKYILSLHNLRQLKIESCPNLKVVFSASMSKSLPQLSHLGIKDCPGLVHLIEEDDDKDHLHQQLCFPKLQYISIEQCDSLKFLFSISTIGILPKLRRLEIVDASELKQVFIIRQEYDMKEMAMEDVFPTLSRLILKRLPLLVSVCWCISFQTVEYVEVVDCPRYQETTPQLQQVSQNEAAKEELLPSAHSSNDVQEMPPNTGQTSASPNLEESSKEAIGISAEEVPTSKKSSLTTTETSMEKDTIGFLPALKEYLMKANLPADSQLRTPSKHKLEDEHAVSEPNNVQLQHQDRGNEMKWPEHSVTESIEADKETKKEDGKVVRECDDTVLTSLREFPIWKKSIGKQGFQGSMKGIIRKQSEVPLENSLGNEFAQVASMEKTLKQGFQEHDTSKDAIQSSDSESMKQSTVPSDIAEIGQRDKETMKKGLQENYAQEEAMRVIQAASSDLTKQSTEPFLKLPEKDSTQSTKEVSKKTVEEVTATETPPMSAPIELFRLPTIKEPRVASVEERPKLLKPMIVNLSDYATPLFHRQPQIGSASSSSSTLEMGEILELVEVKDDERALLEKALELYPQLRLSRRSRPIIAFAYKALIDILIMLSTKTPYTITEADKSTLEANLGAATFFGFDKDWVESVRARVFDMDMSDVLETKEKILIMEAKLEANDSDLEHMRKERAEAKERLALGRRELEMAQSEFEAIDSLLLGLLEDCKKLIANMAESREISPQDGPFGI